METMNKRECDWELTYTEIAILQSAVNKGVELLDDLAPGWYRDVNLDELDMESCEECVVGQAIKHARNNLFLKSGYFCGYSSKFGFNNPLAESIHREHDRDAFAISEHNLACFYALEDMWTQAVKDAWAGDKL